MSQFSGYVTLGVVLLVLGAGYLVRRLQDKKRARKWPSADVLRCTKCGGESVLYKGLTYPLKSDWVQAIFSYLKSEAGARRFAQADIVRAVPGLKGVGLPVSGSEEDLCGGLPEEVVHSLIYHKVLQGRIAIAVPGVCPACGDGEWRLR